MTVINNVTEENGKTKKLISLIGFPNANKINNYNRVGRKGKIKEKIQKNLQVKI